jgi:signal transduction histidine kinase
MIQEQMKNILLHSNATVAAISLSGLENEIILFISDNGNGCDILKENTGVGILNIRSRAELYDGRVDVLSKPGEGFALKVSMDLVTKPALLDILPA